MNKDLISAWLSIVNETSVDGLVCDIIATEIDINNWLIFFHFIQTNFPYKYIFNQRQQKLPISIDHDFFQINELSQLSSLEIYVGSFIIECVIITIEKIEMTVVPYLIVEISQIQLLFDLIENLSIKLQKKINIIIEGNSTPLIIFYPFDKVFINNGGYNLGK